MTGRRLLFAAVLAFTLVAALMPGDRAPDLGHGDKVNHIAAFVTLTFLAAWAWPRIRPPTIGIALSALGAAIEGLQALPIIARDAEWSDWIADTAAVVAALIVVILMRWLRRSRA